MKIAYLSTFYPYRGGIAQFNAKLYRELEDDHEVKAYTFFRQYPKLLFPGKTQLVQPGDKADSIPSTKVLDTVNPISYHRASMKILKDKPDVMLTKFWMPFFAPSLGWVAKSLSKESVINISILDNVVPHEKRIGDDGLIKYFLNNNHAFVVMSNTVENDLLKYKPDAKYKKVPHPIYNNFGEKLGITEARDLLKLPQDKKILLFFGFIRKYKGLDILLNTLKKLDDTYHVLIAGEVYGSFLEYQEIIEKNDLQDRVTINNDYIKDDEVAYYFSAADVCVLPYRSATQSGIMNISYHFDLPLIVTDTGSLAVEVKEYQTGLVAEKADVKSLKSAIQQYFDEAMYDTLSENIKKHRAAATWGNMAKAIEELYAEILSEREDEE